MKYHKILQMKYHKMTWCLKKGLNLLVAIILILILFLTIQILNTGRNGNPQTFKFMYSWKIVILWKKRKIMI